MFSLLTIQILSIIGTALTNLIGILAFATDYWSIIIYDADKLHQHIQWIATEDARTGKVAIRPYMNVSYQRNWTESSLFNKQQLDTVVLGINNDTILFKTHKGIFRQCNTLPVNTRERLKISKCRLLKLGNNRYDDGIHGMNNPGRELIRLHNVAAACAILIVLLLCACTLVGVTVGILKGVVLATMTIGIIYLVATLFSVCLLAIMHTVLKSERKSSNCFALEVLIDQFCASRTIQPSYSFYLGALLIIVCFITSVLWLSLQEKQRKFAQH